MLRGRTSTPPRPWPMQKLFSTSTSIKLLRRKGSPVSKPMATRRLLLRTLATIFGVALLTYLIWRVGPGRLVEDIATLGWGLALVIALGGVAHVVKAWAWRFT